MVQISGENVANEVVVMLDCLALRNGLEQAVEMLLYEIPRREAARLSSEIDEYHAEDHLP